MPSGFPKRPRALSPTRVCSVCKTEKPNTEDFFQKRSQRQWRLGLQSYCRTCNKERTKRQHNARRLRALQHYAGSAKPFCACCGESQVEFLGLDHIEGGGNRHRKMGESATSIALWVQRHGFPPGFQVLCHNCNLAKGFYGVCPHKRTTSPTT